MSGLWLVTSVLVIVIGGLVIDYWIIGRPGHRQVSSRDDQIPTLFVPGHFGTRYAFGHMLWRLSRYGVSKDVVAVVGRRGVVRLYGRLDLRHHSAVQVLFVDKRVRPLQQRSGIEHVIVALQQQANFSKVNLVTHSMAGVTAVLYTLSSPKVPVANLVTIAAPLNDLEVADRSPILNWRLTRSGPEHKAPVYQYFQAHLDNIPSDLRWLNIAGDILVGGQHDGAVSVASSFAIRFLVKDKIQDYREVVIRGPQAAHSLLHENRLVDRDIARFLWPQAQSSLASKPLA